MPDLPLPVLISLRSYSGHPDLLSHIVPGRPVRCVRCVCLALSVSVASKDSCQLDNYAIHSGLVWSFLDISRSAVLARSLMIEYYLSTLEHLNAIVRYLPNLHHLEFVLIDSPPPMPVIAIREPLGIATTLLSPWEDVDLASYLFHTCGTMGVRRIVILFLHLRNPSQVVLS